MTSRNPFDRPSLNKWLALPVTLAAGTLGATVALRRLMRRPVPRPSGRVTLDGLRAPVEIIRDEWGVPHIYAADEHDLFFGQGYTQAQDRLFQMDLNRRLGLGRLAELTGPLGVPFDKFARYLAWPRAAQAQVDDGDETTRAAIDAYAAGVNAFVATQPLPAEFKLLATRPEPWDALATSAWGTVLAWGLSCNWETELLRAWLLEALGPERAADLTPVYGDDYATTLPDERVGRRLAEGLLSAFHETIACGPVGVPLVGQGLGSNNWVVSGARTTSGRPHLANDPHLPPVFPTIWYACHLVGGPYDVAGFTLPGVPGIIIGHNAHCAWGITNAFPDVQDVYVERFAPDDPTRYEVNGQWVVADVREETIRVRGARSIQLTLRTTRHGPVFSDILPGHHADLSYNWTMFQPGSHLRAVLATNRATDWPSFHEALRHWSFPSQNVVYADTSGLIAYMMPGRVPRRRKGDGLTPAPGWVDDFEWDGFIPFEELPLYVNPPEGYVATANNCIAGDNYPYLLTGEWLSDYRVRRIRELLAERPALTLDDHRRIQNESVSLMARRFLAAALPAIAAPDEPPLRNALEQLAAWDDDMAEDSVPATLYFGWLVHFTRAAVAQAVGQERAETLLAKGEQIGFPFMPFYEIAYELALWWLEGSGGGDGLPEWVGDVRPLLLPALRETLDALRRELGRDPAGWVWGRVHRVSFQHEMTRLPGIGRLWKPVTIPAAGDGYTINQSDLTPHFPPDPATIIASCRLIMDVGAWDDCLGALPGGQSGHPASPHYQDRIAEWRAGEYFPLLYSRERVVAASRGTWWLEPS
ncbi:penicillin acylase family protein [Promineifilum sp.]|uniref:penicillin acylase family protein n=1 Tax=Promineifilum sp. TaxID=2664178 RepID=UPI0035B1FE30